MLLNLAVPSFIQIHIKIFGLQKFLIALCFFLSKGEYVGGDIRTRTSFIPCSFRALK